MLSTLVQIGIPGGPELLIIFIIMFMIAIPVVGIVLVVLFLRSRNSADEERIEELEREVAELRAEQTAPQAGTDESDGPDGDTDGGPDDGLE